MNKHKIEHNDIPSLPNFKRLVFLYCMGVAIPFPYGGIIAELMTFLDIDDSLDYNSIGNKYIEKFNNKAERLFTISKSNGYVTIDTDIKYIHFIIYLNKKYSEYIPAIKELEYHVFGQYGNGFSMEILKIKGIKFDDFK